MCPTHPLLVTPCLFNPTAKDNSLPFCYGNKNAITPVSILNPYCLFISRSQKNAKMTAFFRNNFSEDRWRKAALKNAFSLLGKQRFQHSAAFFLLAGSLKDAVEASEKYSTHITHCPRPVILFSAVKHCFFVIYIMSVAF